MNPINIEEADRNFVRKLGELRSHLAVRQMDYQQRASHRSRRRFTLLFMPPLLLLGVGLALFHVRQQTGPADESQPAAPLDRRKNLHHRPETVAARPAPMNRPLERLSPASPIPASPVKTVPSARPSGDDTVDSGQELPTTAERGMSAVDPGQIRLSSALVCEGVRARQPLAQREVFDLLDDERAYLWMEVWSEAQPFVIEHVYYLHGRKYCQVPLDIRYPRMRTWSYVTLENADQAGAWRVEIVHEGRILRAQEFQVRSE